MPATTGAVALSNHPATPTPAARQIHAPRIKTTLLLPDPSAGSSRDIAYVVIIRSRLRKVDGLLRSTISSFQLGDSLHYRAALCLEEKHENMSRRRATRVIAQSAAGLLLARVASGAESTEKKTLTLTASLWIPSSGESLPVVGLGTWQAFDVGSTPAERQPLEEVLALFAKLPKWLSEVDTSLMYGALSK